MLYCYPPIILFILHARAQCLLYRNYLFIVVLWPSCHVFTGNKSRISSFVSFDMIYVYTVKLFSYIIH